MKTTAFKLLLAGFALVIALAAPAPSYAKGQGGDSAAPAFSSVGAAALGK